jgi:hypothetical protein
LPVACCLSPVLLAIAALAAAASCHREINLLSPPDGGASGSGGNSSKGGAGGGGGTGGAAGAAGAAGAPACSGLGPSIVLPTSTGAPCAAALASRGHRFVLCSCDDMTAPARVRSDAFDSTNPAITDQVAAAYGVNGSLNAIGEIRAGGAVYVAGANGITAAGQFQTGASLRVGGPMIMTSSDNADIGGDAYVNGNVTGNVRVAGTLHVPASAVLSGGVEDGQVVNEAVTVAAPCDCSAGFVDVTAAIAAAATSNADAAIGLAPTALAPLNAPKTIDLYCGSYYLTAIDAYATAAVTLVVHGRALLAVAGDVTVRDGFAVQLDPSAELDLLIAGGLTTRNGGTFGAANAPARFRVWVAGTSSIVFDGTPWIDAVVHAPSAAVTATAGLPLSGSLLARSISIGADSMLHYDRAILAAGTVCGEPAAAVVP